MRQTANRAQGFSLIAAIFILIVLSAAAAAALRLSGVQRTTSDFGLQGTRAYYAARSGIEWAIGKIALDGDCDEFDADGPDGLFNVDAFQMTVRCTGESTHHTVNGWQTVYHVESKAEYPIRDAWLHGDYVRRRLRATLTPSP